MRVLVVTYQFPPVGGAGVQRMAKLVRYLPEHGVEPVVLTASNPSTPLRDETLLADVPTGVRVVRVPTLEPGYASKQAAVGGAPGSRTLRGAVRSAASTLLFPDPQVLWLPAAAPRALALARGVDAVLVSAPPFSQFALAPWLARLTRARVVIDYRDEWTTTLRAGHEQSATARVERLAAALEGRVLASVAGVTTATAEFREALLARFSSLDPRRVHVVPNGYDPADLPASAAEPPTDKLVLTYAGTVFRLTSLRGLVGALRRLAREQPDLAKLLEVRLYGRVVPSEEGVLAGAESLGVRRFGYVDHARVVEALASSHLNACVLDAVAGAERIYPAKIFELLALGTRVLVLAPEGALTRLAERHHAGDVVAPRDEAAIAAVLARHLAAFRDGRYDRRSHAVDVARYDRRALAGRMAAILRDPSAPTPD